MASKNAAATGGSDYSTTSDIVLQNLYSKGDELARNELFERNYAGFLKLAERVCRYCWWCEPNDAVNDLFVHLAEKSAYTSYCSNRPFFPWACTVLRRMVLCESRRQTMRYWTLQGKWQDALKKNGGVPAVICEKLAVLDRRRFYNEGEFLIAVETLLTGAEFASYWSEIVARARHGVELESLDREMNRQLVDSKRFSSAEIAILREFLQRVAEALPLLSTFEQDVLAMRFRHGMTLKAIADITGTAIHTIDTTIKNAIAKLNGLLA